MDIDIRDFVERCNLDEPFYPGKRIVKKLPQNGEYRNHCVVYDWRDPKKIRVDVKPGLSGRDLSPKELAKYPVSLQATTYIEINVHE